MVKARRCYQSLIRNKLLRYTLSAGNFREWHDKESGCPMWSSRSHQYLEKKWNCLPHSFLVVFTATLFEIIQSSTRKWCRHRSGNFTVRFTDWLNFRNTKRVRYIFRKVWGSSSQQASNLLPGKSLRKKAAAKTNTSARRNERGRRYRDWWAHNVQEKRLLANPRKHLGRT